MGDEDELPDDLRGFEYECPKCGKALDEYAEQCPQCGQNRSEVYSGTFRPKRSVGVKILVFLVLAVFIAAMLLVAIVSLRAMLRR